MNRLQRIEQTRFLGREFLLWLWFSSEQNGGLFQLPKAGEIEFLLEDRLVMEPVFGDGHRHLVTGMDATLSIEAAVALQINKVPSEIKVKIVQHARAWTFALRGDDLQLRSLKIPEVLTKHEDEKVFERVYLLEEIEAILSELFSMFLDNRIGDDWDQSHSSIRSWILGKRDEITTF